MKLSRFKIHNFKGLQELDLNWDDILIMIGENNCGKSSVLQALEWFLSGKKIGDEAYFCDRCCDEENAIDLIGYFTDLTPPERSATAVQGRMYGDEWILKKQFWRDADGKWQEQYYSYSEEEIFAGWPENERSWGNWTEEYLEMIPNRPGRPNTDTKDILRELVRQHRPHLIHVEPNWQPNPGGGGSWKSNANSILPRVIFVRAVHDATADTQAKDTTPFGKIINLVVGRKLMQKEEVQELHRQLKRVLDLIRPDPEHPENQAEEIHDLEDDISNRLRQLIPAQASLRTDEPDIQPLLLPNTTLVLDDGFETTVEHQGHGLQRALIVSLLQILAELESEPENEEGDEDAHIRPTILAVEEPELYLHPQMERKMRDALYRLAESPHYQVICTTHSPVFLNMAAKHRSIVRLEKNWETRCVTKRQVTSEIFTGETAEDQKGQLRMILDFDPTVNELFFAKRVVLVEGDTEIAVLAKAAQLEDIFREHPHLQHDVTLINCHGKWTIPAFQKVLNHFQIEYFVLYDRDGDKGEDNPAFAANEKIDELLESLDHRHMFTENIEQALGMTEISTKDKPIKALCHLHDLYQNGAGIPREFAEAVRLAYLGTNL
jgi:hypothetical protein